MPICRDPFGRLRYDHLALRPSLASTGRNRSGRVLTRLHAFEPGIRILLERTPNHYRDDEGYFDQVELLNIADTVARANGLRSKKFDVITRPDPKTAKLLGAVGRDFHCGRPRQPALHDAHADRHGSLRRCQRSAGHQVCH